MRILVHVTLTTMLRHFESVLLSLADRGHTVRIASPVRKSKAPPLPALEAHRNISFITAPDGWSDHWKDRIADLRVLRDYLRYLEPRFADSSKRCASIPRCAGVTSSSAPPPGAGAVDGLRAGTHRRRAPAGDERGSLALRRPSPQCRRRWLEHDAQLEAAVAGEPVLTVLVPEFAAGQQGTLHFSYLLKEQGGFVELAPDMETHLRQLAAAVAGEYDPHAIRRFVESFLRQRGIDRLASPIMVEAIEALADERRARAAAGQATS